MVVGWHWWTVPTFSVAGQYARGAADPAVFGGLAIAVVGLVLFADGGGYSLVPGFFWRHLRPLLEPRTGCFVDPVRLQSQADKGYSTAVLDLLPRVADRLLSADKPDTNAVALLLDLLISDPANDGAADRCLQLLTARIRSGEITGAALTQLRERLQAGLLTAAAVTPARPGTVSAG